MSVNPTMLLRIPPGFPDQTDKSIEISVMTKDPPSTKYGSTCVTDEISLHDIWQLTPNLLLPELSFDTRLDLYCLPTTSLTW